MKRVGVYHCRLRGRKNKREAIARLPVATQTGADQKSRNPIILHEIFKITLLDNQFGWRIWIGVVAE